MATTSMPNKIQIENGEVFDQASQSRIDLNKPEYAVLRHCIESNGQSLPTWQNGAYRFDEKNKTLTRE